MVVLQYEYVNETLKHYFERMSSCKGKPIMSKTGKNNKYHGFVSSVKRGIALREEKRLIDRIQQIRDAAIEAIRDLAEKLVDKYQVRLQINGKISETGVDATYNVNLQEIMNNKIEGERRRIIERLITRIKKRLEGFDESLLRDSMELDNMALSFGIKIPFVAEGCTTIYISKK